MVRGNYRLGPPLLGLLVILAVGALGACLATPIPIPANGDGGPLEGPPPGEWLVPDVMDLETTFGDAPLDHASNSDAPLGGGDAPLGDAPLFDGVPVEGGPVEGGPVEGGPVESGLVEGGPVEGGPVEGGPVEGGPVEGGPVEGGPVEGGGDL